MYENLISKNITFVEMHTNRADFIILMVEKDLTGFKNLSGLIRRHSPTGNLTPFNNPEWGETTITPGLNPGNKYASSNRRKQYCFHKIQMPLATEQTVN
jgi:hypothetical protein